jgi:hypothetical protein
LAGLSLWLCALKPHLFLPFAAVLLVWIIVSRSYRLLFGAAVAMAASCAALYCIDSMAWAQYAQMMRVSGIQKEFLPCPSVALRTWISPQTAWIPYVLPALACAWALGYYWRRRHAWNWLKEGSMLMLVSVFVAPFCWLFDQALVIPAMLQAGYLLRFRFLVLILVTASVLLEVELVRGINLTSVLYLWASSAWLAWYLVATLYKGKKTEAIPGSAVIAG